MRTEAAGALERPKGAPAPAPLQQPNPPPLVPILAIGDVFMAAEPQFAGLMRAKALADQQDRSLYGGRFSWLLKGDTEATADALLLSSLTDGLPTFRTTADGASAAFRRWALRRHTKLKGKGDALDKQQWQWRQKQQQQGEEQKHGSGKHAPRLGAREKVGKSSSEGSTAGDKDAAAAELSAGPPLPLVLAAHEEALVKEVLIEAKTLNQQGSAAMRLPIGTMLGCVEAVGGKALLVADPTDVAAAQQLLPGDDGLQRPGARHPLNVPVFVVEGLALELQPSSTAASMCAPNSRGTSRNGTSSHSTSSIGTSSSGSSSSSSSSSQPGGPCCSTPATTAADMAGAAEPRVHYLPAFLSRRQLHHAAAALRTLHSQLWLRGRHLQRMQAANASIANASHPLAPVQHCLAVVAANGFHAVDHALLATPVADRVCGWPASVRVRAARLRELCADVAAHNASLQRRHHAAVAAGAAPAAGSAMAGGAAPARQLPGGHQQHTVLAQYHVNEQGAAAATAAGMVSSARVLLALGHVLASCSGAGATHAVEQVLSHLQLHRGARACSAAGVQAAAAAGGPGSCGAGVRRFTLQLPAQHFVRLGLNVPAIGSRQSSGTSVSSSANINGDIDGSGAADLVPLPINALQADRPPSWLVPADNVAGSQAAAVVQLGRSWQRHNAKDSGDVAFFGLSMPAEHLGKLGLQLGEAVGPCQAAMVLGTPANAETPGAQHLKQQRQQQQPASTLQRHQQESRAEAAKQQQAVFDAPNAQHLASGMLADVDTSQRDSLFATVDPQGANKKGLLLLGDCGDLWQHLADGRPAAPMAGERPEAIGALVSEVAVCDAWGTIIK